jgi:hypothetical protein
MMCGQPGVRPFMDIVVWLRGLGFGKYEAAFRTKGMRKVKYRPDCGLKPRNPERL